jgi:hypothetical protein
MSVTGAMIAHLQSFSESCYVDHIMLFDDKIVTMMGHPKSIQLWNFSASKMGTDKIRLLKIYETRDSEMTEIESYPWDLLDTCAAQLGVAKNLIVCKMVFDISEILPLN